ncbi:MAG: SMP-30/gluconolactonase/LRE family protein [Pseudomonadota bacterium]
MDIEILAEGLRFPEGPVVMADGSIILVEIARGAITRVWGDGRSEVVATPGDGPNGAAVGPDGALYICNNGGFEYHDWNGLLVPGHAPENYQTGRIERIDLNSGHVDRLYDACDGRGLKGPNDIVFDRHGGFYFTDLGKSYGDRRVRDFGGLYYALPDGSKIVELADGLVSPNGVGLSPNEDVVYVADTIPGRLWAFDVVAPGELAPSPIMFQKGRLVAGPGGGDMFDSLAVTASGAVCVATLLNGGVTTIQPDGAFAHTPMPDPLVTNICFGGDDLSDAFITLSGTGKLARARWPEPGLKLNFNA